MDTSQECHPLNRSLYACEVEEARRVFGDQMHFERVHVHECAKWPNTINSLGVRIKKMDPSQIQPNAITLGNNCFFPVNLQADQVPPDDPRQRDICWLMHELTHVWQFQHMGWIYLIKALSAQIRLKSKAYDYGGENGLQEALQKGWRLDQFNMEQQGDIARDYYWRISHKFDAAAWIPYIQQFQRAA
jgi:hypothetical protein